MSKKEIVAYIHQYFASGYSPAQMRKILIRNGHPEKDVDAAIQEVLGANLVLNEEVQKREKNTLPYTSGSQTALTFVVWMYILLGGVTVIVALMFLMNIFSSTTTFVGRIGYSVGGVLLAGLSALYFFLSKGLRTHKQWAWWVALILSILSFMNLFSIGVIVVLNLPANRKAFGFQPLQSVKSKQ